jgi:hypothetical protein
MKLARSLAEFRARRFSQLSLTARLGVALWCFERFCVSNGLAHPEISVFLEHLWRFPILPEEDFAAWEGASPALVEAGLGQPLPTEVANLVRDRRLKPAAFHALLGDVVEIVWTSFYGATQDRSSLRHLGRVLRTCAAAGVGPPDATVFSVSLLVHRGGWGDLVTPQDCERWRQASTR